MGLDILISLAHIIHKAVCNTPFLATEPGCKDFSEQLKLKNTCSAGRFRWKSVAAPIWKGEKFAFDTDWHREQHCYSSAHDVFPASWRRDS